MKKLYSFFCLLLMSIPAFCQTFSGPSTATSGTTITLTAVGESYDGTRQTPYYYFSNIQDIYNSNNTYSNYSVSNPSQYVTIDLQEVTHMFNPLSQSPTILKVNVYNTATSPITVTFNVSTQYAFQSSGGAGGITGAVNIPYTITINPTVVAPPVIPPPHNGDFVRNMNTGALYMFFEGKLRYFPTMATLNGLFAYSPALLRDFTAAELAYYNVQYGAAFSQASRIIMDSNNGAVYLLEDLSVRQFPNMAIANGYHVNWNYMLTVNGINSPYVIGAPIYL